MDTYDFDYAFAVQVDKINEILQTNLSGIDMSIAYTARDEESDSTITMKARLAPWKIVRGGQNTLLNMHVPFAAGTLTLDGALSGKYDLAGVTAEMQIRLGWLGPGNQQQAAGGGSAIRLVFNPDDTKSKDNPGYVATLQILDPNKHLNTVAAGLVRAYMAAALVSHKENLQYVFANVYPAPSGLSSWLKPVKWLYYYSETGSSSALCFLCLMSDAPFPQPAFDSTALASDANAVLLISQPLFFRNVVLPGVQSAFPGGDFRLISENQRCSITSHGDVNLKNVTAHSFTMTASSDGNGLATAAGGGGPLKFLFGLVDLPDASYSWGIRTTNPLRFADGRITFQNDPKPAITQDHTMYWYDWVLLVAVGITSLPGLISAIIALVSNFADQLENVGVVTINNNVQSAVGGTAMNLANVVHWHQGGQKLDITSVGMSGPLVVRGRLI